MSLTSSVSISDNVIFNSLPGRDVYHIENIGFYAMIKCVSLRNQCDIPHSGILCDITPQNFFFDITFVLSKAYVSRST